MEGTMRNDTSHYSSFIEKGETKYQLGLLCLRQGKLNEAINLFAKASFFMPEKPQPFIAAAECYVLLCDFQGAVQQYRRSLWLLRSSGEQDKMDPPPPGVVTLPRDVLHEHEVHNIPAEASDMDPGEVIMDEEDLTRPSVTLPFSGSLIPFQVIPDGCSSVGAATSGSDRFVTSMVKTRLAGILDALSIVLFNTKDYVQALRFAEDSLELSYHPQVVLHRCAYLIALEREDEAEKTLEKHLKENPTFFIESSSLLVHLYCLRQAFQHAHSLLEKVPNDARQNPQILLAQHIFDRAYSAFRQRSVVGGDLQGITRCLLVFPQDTSLLFERAKCHISNGMDKKAVPDLFRCIKLSDGGQKSAVELMTKTLFRLGASLDGEKSIRDAIEYYTSSLIWHGDNIPVLLARGDCYTKLEDYQHALQDFLRVENISPKNPDSTRRIAFLHDIWGCKFYEQGNMNEAEREFSSAIETCDTEPLFFYHRARCRFELNEQRYALRDVLSCRNLNSQNPMIREFVAAHMGSLAQGSEAQRQVDVKLPEVPSRISRRALTLQKCAGENVGSVMHVKPQRERKRVDADLPASELPATVENALTCKSVKLMLPSDKSGAARCSFGKSSSKKRLRQGQP